MFEQAVVHMSETASHNLNMQKLKDSEKLTEYLRLETIYLFPTYFQSLR